MDATGSVFFAGHSNSPNFPTQDPLFGYPNDGNFNVFVAKMNPSGSALEFSSYLGGSSFEDALGIAIDGKGAAFVVGYTEVAVNPPFFQTTAGAFQTKHAGNADIFAAKITGLGSGTPGITPPELTIKLAGSTAVISWPTAAVGFILETTGNISSPPSWVAETTTVLVIDNKKQVTVPLIASPRFYRLRKS